MQAVEATGKRRGGGRASRIGRRTAPERSPAPAYVTRRVPVYDLMDEEALASLEDQAEWVLKEVGVNVEGDPEGLALLADAGATVQGTNVRFETGLARHLCRTAPASFAWHGRDSAKVAQVGGDAVIFGPVFGPPYVHDLDRGRRSGTLADFTAFARLTQALPQLHFNAVSIAEPNELPLNKRHLDMIEVLVRNGDKPFFGASSGAERAADSVEMARIVFGADFVASNVVTGGVLNINSPLAIDHITTGVMKTYARAGQFVMLAPFIMTGAMAPVTVPAAIAQHHAECTAAIALYQLYRPGAPVVCGTWLTTMDLRTGAPTFGTPEATLATLALCQLCRRMGVPFRAGGAFTSSKLPDGQAMRESGDTLLPVMAGANMVLAAAGWLEAGMTASYEKFVMDADNLGAMARTLAGLSLDAEQMGRDAYADVASGGNFLATAHTRRHFETVNHASALNDSRPYEHWAEAGAEDIAARANRRWKSLLEAFEAPPLDPGVGEALADYVARRKSAMPDEWY